MNQDAFTRFAAVVEYDGHAFQGWQAQKHHTQTVQHAVDTALSRIANAPIKTTCAGRTDTGVHALHQVVHFDAPQARRADQWLMGTNSKLPHGVKLKWVGEVDPTFHARYSALSRRYVYVMERGASPSALQAQHSTWIRQPLAVQAMRDATQYLVGTHDFSAFRSAGCSAKTTTRTMHHLTIGEWEHWLWVDVCANAFLQRMVRNIVGALMSVGKGLRPPEWVDEVLKSGQRERGAPTAVANGLYLCEVRYPETFGVKDVNAAAFPLLLQR